MNVAEQLKKNAMQFSNCFYYDKMLGLRIFLFIVTAFAPMVFFVVESIFLWAIRLLQVSGEELIKYLKDATMANSVKCLLTILCSPVIYLRFVLLSFIYIPYWLFRFLANCFDFCVSLGKSGWYGLQI
ncbi:MAG: hypothetical protein ACI4M8_03010 [Christensenellales bacterium]